MQTRRNGARLDWSTAPALPITFIGLGVLWRGVYLISQFLIETVDPAAYKWLLAGNVILAVAAALVFIRGHRVLALLVVLPGVVTLSLGALGPGAIFPALAFLPLAPASLVAALVAFLSSGRRSSVAEPRSS